jgi:hypothetical protein
MAGVAKVANKQEALRKMVEEERMKVDLTKATWLDKVLVEELSSAITTRAEIKKSEDELDIQKKNVVAQIEVLLDTLQIAGGVLPSVGTVVQYTQERSNLDKSKLKEELLKQGIPAEIIMQCFYKSTTFSKSSGVKFTSS